MIDKQRVASRFNRAVSTYDQHAQVQKKMAHQLIQWLRESSPRSVHRILEIGCGTGYLSQLLLQEYPTAEIIAIDLAEQMIQLAQERIHSPRVEFRVGDAEEIVCEGKFDLILSSATVQWLTQPQTTFARWRDWLQPNGEILFSTFGPATFHELHTLFHQTEEELGIAHGWHGLQLRTGKEWAQLLQAAGFAEVEIKESYETLIYSDCRSFLKSLHATGANYSESGSHLGRHLLQQVIERYNQRYQNQSQSGVTATYHLLYTHGRKDFSRTIEKHS